MLSWLTKVHVQRLSQMQMQMAVNSHCTIFLMMFFRVVTIVLGFEESDNR